MSFTLQLAHFSAEQAAFGFSSAHETLLALHVFYDCKHHPLHVPWVLNARKKVSPGLKDEIDKLSFFYQRPLVTFWDLHEDSSLQPFDGELNLLAQLPIQTYQDKVLTSISGKSDQYPKSKEALLLLRNNPDESRQQFLQLMQSFWDTCLKEEWPRIEELLLKDISYRGQILMSEGILPLMDSLSPEISIDLSQKKAVLRRISKAELEFSEQDHIFFAPSYFIWPHLFVKRDRPIGINYSIMENQYEAKRPIPPENLMKFLKALGDLTRLQIVKYLADKPRSTRELALLIGITEGAVSKHLKQLQDIGIISSKRNSYYVFYKLNEEPFNQFTHGLNRFIQK